MRIYANIESEKSLEFFKKYEYKEIEMSSETYQILSTILRESKITEWFLKHEIKFTPLGKGIVSGIN